MKYIVKNCPAYFSGVCHSMNTQFECCSKNNDCPIKQIIELCKHKDTQTIIPENYFKRNNYSWKQHQLKALDCKFEQILKILDIEEVK